MNRILPAFGLAAFAGLLALTWTALFLAEVGKFHAGACLIVALVAGAAVLAWRLRSRAPDSANGPLWPLGVALLIAGSTLFLTLPPSEMILGGWDPGVYLHTAATLARQHSLQFFFADFSRITEPEGPLIARSLHGVPELFGGMRMMKNGLITPQFYHAYPSILAVAWSTGGIWGALLVNPLLNIGCLLAMYVLASRLVGPYWALGAVAALALNPAQIWQARFSTAEVACQFFLLGGAALWIPPPGSTKPRGFELILVGLALGLAQLTRYDVLILMVPWLVLLSLNLFDLPDRRGALLMMLAFGILALQAWLHQKWVAPFYDPLSQVVKPCLFAVLVTVVPWLLIRKSRTGERLVAWLSHRQGMWSKLLAVAFAIWALFAGFIRPALESNRLDARIIRKILLSLNGSGVLEFLQGKESTNLFYLANLFGTVGLVLGLWGLLLLILRARSIWIRTWLYSSLFVMLVLVTAVFNDHFMMWVSRRYVPVVVPLLALGMTLAATWVQGWVARFNKTWAPWLAAGVLIGVLAMNLPASLKVAQYRDWPGLIGWFEKLQKAIPDEALVYSDQPGFSAPLRFLYGKCAYELHFPDADKYEELSRIMGRKSRSGQKIYFLSENKPPSPSRVHFEPVGSFPLSSHILDTPRRGIPRAVKHRGGDFVLYRIVYVKVDAK